MRLTIELSEDQAQRLEELTKTGDYTPSEMIGAMIDLDYEEWQDGIDPQAVSVSRAARWLRFVVSERS